MIELQSIGAYSNGAAVMMIRHFPKTFPTRIQEWLCAAMMTTFGWNLYSVDVPTYGRYFGVLFQHVPIPIFATAIMIAGLIRLSTLFINGAIPQSPYIRALMSIIGFMFWLQISYGLWSSGLHNTGIGIYPWFIPLELYSAVRASREARHFREAKKERDKRG